MSGRMLEFRHCEAVCTDCGNIVDDADHRDPDNAQNCSGCPVCTCRRPRQ